MGAGKTRNHMIRDNVADRHARRVGTTFGLDLTCDRDSHSMEQVYVQVDTHPEVVHHPIYIEGWIGYVADARLRLSIRQAAELIGLLSKAIATLPAVEFQP